MGSSSSPPITFAVFPDADPAVRARHPFLGYLDTARVDQPLQYALPPPSGAEAAHPAALRLVSIVRLYLHDLCIYHINHKNHGLTFIIFHNKFNIPTSLKTLL
jgi:hypothetical protein